MLLFACGVDNVILSVLQGGVASADGDELPRETMQEELARMVVIYGRRRIGKTELVKRLISGEEPLPFTRR